MEINEKVRNVGIIVSNHEEEVAAAKLLSSLSEIRIASAISKPFSPRFTIISFENTIISSFALTSHVLEGKKLYLFGEIPKLLIDLEEKEKKEEVILNNEHKAIVTTKGIQVGCQLFPLEVAQKLVDAIKRVTIGT